MTIKEGGNYYELRYNVRYSTEERGRRRRRWERRRWSWSWSWRE
jgi:hypothetical protein